MAAEDNFAEVPAVLPSQTTPLGKSTENKQEQDKQEKHIVPKDRITIKVDIVKESASDSDTAMTEEKFLELLNSRLVKKDLPSDFDMAGESKHLAELWARLPHLQKYEFKHFVHAGGSGMVFEVIERDRPFAALAMKIVRSGLYSKKMQHPNAVQGLSPISNAELLALEIINHPYIVRLHDTVVENDDIVAICTTYINPPQQIDEYIEEILNRKPTKSGLKSFSPERLNLACEFLIARFTEIASALAYMHNLKNGNGIYHFDIKPANILIARHGTGSGIKYNAILTDMGSCIHRELIEGQKEIRVHFTWPYAHKELRDLLHDPMHITGGLKVSAKVDPEKGLAQYDLFAFGKTIQSLLAILMNIFGERCQASYAFRFLHIIACMLLDGHNSLEKDSVRTRDRVPFVSDLALDYSRDLWKRHKITSASELLSRLSRFSREYSWNDIAPELDIWQPHTVNCVAHAPAPFTDRVSEVMNHPCMRRLKSELQLGWIREVFPGASHDRWSHCLGTFSALVGYYNALLSDPEVPTFRILTDKDDLIHAFVAALIHDLGQTTFGHDFEEACPKLFQHEGYTSRLLTDERWKPTLAQVITEAWGGIDIKRITTILRISSDEISKEKKSPIVPPRAVDCIAANAINGPIDADKLDYLLRDSVACGVPYGHGMDTHRFLQALTVCASPKTLLCLAYKAKGRPAIASLLLARYQMYGAVYWHHTFRCIQAMFVHAAATTFLNADRDGIKFKSVRLFKKNIEDLFYERVICRSTWKTCSSILIGNKQTIPTTLWDEPPLSVGSEPALDFVWQFGDQSVRELLERLAERKLYKRVFEINLGQLKDPDYTAIATELSGPSRLGKSKELETKLFDAIMERLRGSEETSTIKSVTEAHTCLNRLRRMQVPLVILDFPTRVTRDYNLPKELEDPVRKYLPIVSSSRKGGDIVSKIWALQKDIATVRIFAEPDLHDLITRYLNPDLIKENVELVIKSLQQTE